MARDSEEFSYSSYHPEGYYESFTDVSQMQHTQQHQQQHQHQQQLHQQQFQHHLQHQYQQPPSSVHPHAQASQAYYGQQHHYASSSQAGPSYYAGTSQPYHVAVEDDYHEESVPYDDHGSTYPTFGQFQLDQGAYGDNSNIEHIITEQELSPMEVAAYFPPSNKTEIHTDKGVIWLCKVCAKEIPARNKIEHIFKHKDQPRYTCSCKAKFARGQDKNRHLKEQALCSECQTTKVGRRGQNGKCQMCL